MATVTSSKRQLTHTSNTYESNGDVTIGGNLNINGTTTTIDTANLLVEDKNIIIGDVTSPSDTTADGGGITLKGASDKTINWVNSTDSWTSNQRFSAPNLTLTSLSTQSSETTALVVNGSNVVGTRELGSNAFNSTSFLTGNQTITLSGDVSGSGTTSISVTVADDSHNHVISNVDGLQTALNAKAPLASPALTGSPTAPTQSSSESSTKIATTAYVKSQGYITSADGGNATTLDGVDSSSFLRSDTADTATGNLYFNGTQSWRDATLWQVSASDGAVQRADARDDDTDKARLHWYGKTDSGTNTNFRHAWYDGSAYVNVDVTSQTVTFDGAIAATGGNSTNWNTAYGWGNHASAGYITGNQTITLSGDVSGSGTTSISVTVNDDSHNHHRLDSTDDRDMKPNTSGISNSVQAIKPFFSSYGGMTGSANTVYVDVLAFDTYSDSSGGGPSAITFKKANSSGNPEMHIWKAGFGGTTWGTGQRVFADNYHPNADTLTTARTIALSGAVTGSASFNGGSNITIATTNTADPTLTLSGDATGSATFTNLGNATLSVTVADDSHNHVISNVDGLQSALDGKLGSGEKAADSNLLDGVDSSAFVRTSNAQTISGVKTYQSRGDFTNADGLRTNQVRTYNGQQLVLNAGESSAYFTGQTDELIYLNAESGIQINSSPDNWSSGWAGRKTTTINDANGDSVFSRNITLGGTVDGRDVAADGTKLDGIASGATANTGTLTSVGLSVGTGLDGGGTVSGSSGSFNTISLDLSELTDMTGAINTSEDELILLDNGAERRKLFSEIFGSNAFNSTAYAPLASPALTGSPTAPTQSSSENSTKIATTAYVKSQGYITSANGGNANTLDGYDSTQFLKSDANDTMSGTLTFSGASSHIALQQDHVVFKRFDVTVDEGVTNSTTAYLLLCRNAPYNDVNGTVTMDRTSGLRHACSVDIVVSAGTGTNPAGTCRSIGTAGGSSPSYELVTLTYSSNSFIALKITNPDSYYETSGHYFTGRLATTDTTNAMQMIPPASVSSVSSFDSNPSHQINGNSVFHDGYHPNADTLTTARTISLAGDVTGSVSFNGSSNVSITTAVGNDSHTHDSRYYTETETNGFLNLKANLASPAFTGNPTAPTQAANNNSTRIATTAYVQTELADLIGGAPAALDTLNELAAAIGDDASYASSITTALAAKAPLASPALTGAVTVTGSGSSGNAFEVNRGSDSAQALRIQNTGEVVVDSNYLYAAASGTSLYVQNSAVFRGSISNDASGQPVTIGDELYVSGDLTIGSGSSQSNLHIKKADNDVSDHIVFYNGTTRIGEIGAEDDTWLRINQETAKNIYTPRYIRADGGFFVDGASKGIDGSGNFIGGTITGASDANVSNWNTAYGWGNHASAGYVTTDTNTTYSAGTGISLSGTTFSLTDTASKLSLSGGTLTGTLNSRDIKLGSGYHLMRSNHHSGHLEGSYNNVGANAGKSNPIYTIGSGYNPTDAALSNMYGIGYSHTDASFISFTGASGWGQYVAADGDARIFLCGSNGVISSTGEHYVGSNRVFHAGYHPNADTLTTARTIALGGDVTGSASFNGSSNITISASLSSGSVGASEIAANAVGSSEIATNAVTSAKIAADAVGASEIAANAVGASELNVSGNGSTSQFLRSDGDGTFTWATPTDTNTTYSAGTGITLSGTTFSLTDTASKLSLSGGTMSGNIAMGNNNITGVNNIQANGDISLQTSTGEYALYGSANAQTQLYHNGIKKFETTSGGVEVTGVISATGGNSTNWNTAYGWGNHASAGYVTSNTQLSTEQVQDAVGAMLTGNTESGITVTYDDTNNEIDFTVASQTDQNFTTALKSKLDGIATSANNYSLPLSSSSTRGGVKIGYTESGKNYPVELDSSEKMFVNVPWTDNNTTYSVGDGGLTQKNFTTTLKSKLDGIAASANNYSLPAGSSSERGGFKIGYTESGKYYPVEVDSSEKMFVNVPWTDTNTNTTYTAGRGLEESSSEFRLQTDLRDSISYIGYDSNDYIQWSNNTSVRAVVAGTQRLIVGTSGIDVTGNATADTFRTDTNNVNYNLFTRNHSSNTLYVQAAQSNSSQPIATFRYGSATVNGGTETFRIRRDNVNVFGANFTVGGSITGNSKNFSIPHPTKEGKRLVHSCLEGPEIGVYFRGRSTSATIEMPDYWGGLVHLDSMTVELTAIGPNQDLYVEDIADDGDVTVGSNTETALNYFYVVYGERKDLERLEVEIDDTVEVEESSDNSEEA